MQHLHQNGQDAAQLVQSQKFDSFVNE